MKLHTVPPAIVRRNIHSQETHIKHCRDERSDSLQKSTCAPLIKDYEMKAWGMQA
jgi:hypothetical protein